MMQAAANNWLQAAIEGNAETGRANVIPFPVRMSGRRAYEAAKLSRIASDWIASSTSADAEIIGSMVTLRDRARDLVRNSSHAKRALQAFRQNVIGTGLQFRATIRDDSGKRLNRKLNREINRAFYRWAKKRYCHVAARYSFWEMQALLLSEIVEAGEVIIKINTGRMFNRGAGVPLSLEVLEADHLDHNLNKNLPNGYTIRAGIEYNAFGAPVAYHLWDRHPGDSYNALIAGRQTDPRRVPAENIIHAFMPWRIGQGRGVTWFHTMLGDVRNIKGLIQAEIVRSRLAASFMGFIETADDEAFDPEMSIDAEAAEAEAGEVNEVEGDEVTSFEPGTFKKLLPGEKVTFNNPNYSANVDAMVNGMLRTAAVGAGLSYESLTGDYSKTNYSSSRLSLVDERDNYRILQTWFADSILAPLYEKWLDAAVLGGVINIPDYEARPEDYADAHAWRGRGWEWIDPAREITAAKDSIRSGLSTLSETLELRGKDLDSYLEERRDELEQLAEAKILLDTDPRMNAKGAPVALPLDANGNPPADAPASPATPAEGEDGATPAPATAKPATPAPVAANGTPPAEAEANAVTSPQASLNGAQVTSLLQIVKDTIAGLIPFNTAKEMIKVSFALSEEQANAILKDAEGFKPKAAEAPPTGGNGAGAPPAAEDEPPAAEASEPEGGTNANDQAAD